MVRKLSVMTLSLLVAGCGVEVTGTAAVNGANRSQEVQQAKQAQEQFRQKLDAAQQAGQQQRENLDKAGQ